MLTTATSNTRTQGVAIRRGQHTCRVVSVTKKNSSGVLRKQQVNKMGQCFSSPELQSTKSTKAAAGQAGAEKSGPLKVMIAGAPAAGKGTQCARIVEQYGLVHISVGDLLRAEVAAGTPAGKKAKSFMDNGDLVPNDVVVEMVKNKLAEPEVLEKGWLLDGYPRSAEQAEAIEAENIRPDVFLLVNVPDEDLVERVVGRRNDPVTGEIYHLKFKPPPKEIMDRLEQRSDDTEEMVRRRLDTYHNNVNAVVGYYKNELVEIDGAQDMDTVFGSIQKALN
jgi:adenylate kinase